MSHWLTYKQTNKLDKQREEEGMHSSAAWEWESRGLLMCCVHVGGENSLWYCVHSVPVHQCQCSVCLGKSLVLICLTSDPTARVAWERRGRKKLILLRSTSTVSFSPWTLFLLVVFFAGPQSRSKIRTSVDSRGRLVVQRTDMQT